MKRILAPIFLLTLLFPTFAIGETMKVGEKIITKDGWSVVRLPDKKEPSQDDWVVKIKGILCKITGMDCPESLDAKDLVKRDGVYFKKRTDIPFTGKVTGKEHGELKKGKKHGPWVKYWDNGQLSSKGNYKDGKKDGPWVTYHNNGQLSEKVTYKDGKWDGPWVSYNKNGQLWNKGTHKDGKRDGPWIYYREKGQLWFKETYKNGVKVE